MSTLAVENPEIPEVMDTETGDYYTLAAIVGSVRDKAIQKRMAIKEGQLQNTPLYVCSECMMPVTMLMHPESNRFYFKHTLEDGRCSAITRAVGAVRGHHKLITAEASNNVARTHVLL